MNVIHKVKDRENGCPLGHKCDSCNLYQPMYKTEETGEVTQIFDCQFNNIALLLSETKDRVFGVQQSVESSRNESIKRQDRLLNIVSEGERRAALPGQ